jgi:hypothetical protein
MTDFKTIEVRLPDEEEPTTYVIAPLDIARSIRRRFEDSMDPIVICPNSPDCYIVGVRNFWDGATHVYYDGEGTFKFEGWTGPQHFPLIGPLK